MGTQQFILLVLGGIIVVIAVSLAIPYFLLYQENANINEVVNELNDISSDAQGWYRKPTEMGGGNGSYAGFTLAKISQPDSTELATYSVVYANKDSLSLEAVSSSNSGSDFTVNLNVGPHSAGTCVISKGRGLVPANATGSNKGN